jgi:iron complex outermembrane recepter protein
MNPETASRSLTALRMACVAASLICSRAIADQPPTTSSPTPADSTPQQQSAGASSPAAQQAYTKEPELQQVTVTARKRGERPIDIPESITAITANDLVNNGIQTVEDLGRQTPNLQLNMRQDLTTDVVIRGVGAYGDVLGVGFVIDDVPNFTDQTMRLEDLERVEVLKGPQGTLYGGSSIGGIIRYVSKKPQFNWDGESSAEFGSFNDISLFAAQNIPLIANELALRLSGYGVKSDGYITNSALGIYGSPLKDSGVRTSLLFEPTEHIHALLTLRHSYIENGADEYIPVPSVSSFKYDDPLFQATYNRRSTYGAVLELQADLASGFTLTSVSSCTRAAYAQSAAVSLSPPGIPGQTLYTLPGNRPTVVETQELRITSPSGKRFDWLMGLYGASIKDVLLNQNGVSNYPPPALPVTINDFDTKRVDEAVFGTFNYHIGAFTVGAGMRAAETRFRANVFVEAGGLPNQSGSITSRSALPKVSVSYALPGGGQVYANVAKGEEPGAVNTVSVAPIPYKAETAVSHEIGIKGRAPHPELEYELAAFYVNNNNHQFETNQYIPAEGGIVTLISNIGDSRTYGVEGRVDWAATSDVVVRASGGYLNAKWTKGIAFGVPIDGNTIPNAPEASGSVAVAYTRPLPAGLRIDGDLDMSYTDAMWWDLPNTPGSKEAPYWIGNARIALGSIDGSWEVAVRVANFLGSKYWTEYAPNFFASGAYPCPGCSNYGAIGVPREYFASIEFNY